MVVVVSVVVVVAGVAVVVVVTSSSGSSGSSGSGSFFDAKLYGVLACIFLFFARVLIAVGIAGLTHLAVFAMCISVS